MPLPGVIGDPGPDLDEPFDQPLDRAPDPLALDVEPAEHVKQVVGQGSHLEAGLIGPEAVAASLVPAKSVLPLLDPVLDISPTIVDLHHLHPREPKVGHDEIDFGEHLPWGPFQFADHPAGPRPALGTVVEIENLDLRPPLGRAANGPCEMGINESLQVLILGQSDEVGDPLLLAVLVDVRIGKSGVAPKPEQLEPGTVPLHDGMNERESSIGRMHVARTKLCAQAGTAAREGKQGMKTAQTEVAVISNSLLAAVGRVLGGVNVDDQPPPVLLLQQSVGRAPKRTVQCLEPDLASQNLVLQPREHGLARSHFVALAEGKAKRRVDSDG